MRLLLMRHGVAVEPGDPAFPSDHDRPLSPQGRKRTIATVRGMLELGIKPDRIVTSPLRRARQTAEIVAAEFSIGGGQLSESAGLTPDADPQQIAREVRGYSADECVVLIGHEPHLSMLASHLLTGESDGMDILLKKAAVCGIELSGGEARGTLHFLLQPKHLRAAADGD
ncbi:MAG: phosphohistidine phosphatase SixA [Phycisphaerales bacterium]|nr:phosphohistidine phosphatase SixA [Phycisphaerales bacterium]